MNWNHRTPGDLRSADGYKVRKLRTRYGTKYVALAPDGRRLGAQLRQEEDAIKYCEADQRRWVA